MKVDFLILLYADNLNVSREVGTTLDAQAPQAEMTVNTAGPSPTASLSIKLSAR